MMQEVGTILKRRAAHVPRDIVELCDGLSSRELDAAERACGIQFSADHRRFLSSMFPTGPGWPDWREPENRALHEWLDRPREGVLFDVEANAFWPEQWGRRPVDVRGALRVADREVRTWPVLVPISGHSYMPAAETRPGSPVFSVVQTDVIYYGSDLLDFFRHEYGLPRDREAADFSPYRCPPWSLLATDLYGT